MAAKGGENGLAHWPREAPSLDIVGRLRSHGKCVAVRLAWTSASCWGVVGQLAWNDLYPQRGGTVLVDGTAVFSLEGRFDESRSSDAMHASWGLRCSAALASAAASPPNRPLADPQRRRTVEPPRPRKCTRHSVTCGVGDRVAALMAKEDGHGEARPVSLLAKRRANMTVPGDDCG